MLGYPIGLLVLVVLAILVFFGVLQRVLDRMYLKDSTALMFIAAIIIGSFIDIPIARGDQELIVNVGGALVPLALVVYLWVKAGTTKEKVRSLLAAVATSIGLVIASYFIGVEPGTIVDPLYVFPIVAGLIAYLAGRSRRSAFIAAILGVILYDISHYVWLVSSGTRGTTDIGGGGSFDNTVISALLAVALAELIGETRERLQGGPASRGRDKELLAGLKTPGEGDRDNE